MGLFEERYHAGDPFGIVDGRGRLILDDQAASALNAILAELRRLDKCDVAAPWEYGSNASGRRWGIALPERIYCKITGGTNPYSWAEAVRVAGGTSATVTGGRSGSSNAYEANGSATVATGTYTTIDWTAAGDWRFQDPRASTGNSVVIHLLACGRTSEPGTAVTIFSGGSPVASGTTDASGKLVDISSLTTGIYTVTSSSFGAPRYLTPVSFFIPATIPPTPHPFVISTGFTAANGYVCVAASVCRFPISNKLNFAWTGCPGSPPFDGTTVAQFTTFSIGGGSTVAGWSDGTFGFAADNGLLQIGTGAVAGTGGVTGCSPFTAVFTTTLPPSSTCTLTITEAAPDTSIGGANI